MMQLCRPGIPAALLLSEAAKSHREGEGAKMPRAQDGAHRISDLLWERLHLLGGATGRNNNATFVSLFLSICEHLAPAVSLEVGAHEATFSKLVKQKLSHVAAYAFEANPHVFKKFQRQMSEGISYLNQAIGVDESPKEFYIPRSIPQSTGRWHLPQNNLSSSLQRREAEDVEYDVVTCECSTLDRLHENLGWPSSVLWIDVEGAVGEVIRGGIRALDRSVQCAVIELEKSSYWSGQWLAADVVGFMEQMGFHALARDVETSWQYNQIFIKRNLITASIANEVTKYIEGITRQTEEEMRQATGSVLPAQPAPPQPGRVPVAAPTGAAGARKARDRRRELGAWLRNATLLRDDEVAPFLQGLVIPPDFPTRVLARHAPAQAIAAAPGVKSSEVVPAEAVRRPAPPMLTYDGPCPAALTNAPSRNVPATLHEVPGGRVFIGTRLTTLLLDGGRYLAEGASTEGRWLAPAFADAPGALELPGTVAVLFADGATLFSHWMFDLLPKFEVLRRAGWTDDRVDYYVVNQCRGDFQRQTLRHFGIAENKIIADAERLVCAERVLMPSRIRNGFLTPPWVRQFLNANFLEHTAVGSSGSGGALRLYISRAKARRRRVLNEEAVRTTLERHGFAVVFPEQYTIAEFAKLVRNAEHIVAPHGAGVMNVVFARPGVRLLEFYGAHIAPEGWLMTNLVGGRYYLLAGKDDNGRYLWQQGAFDCATPLAKNAADYVVDLADLGNALEMMAAN